MTFLRLAVLAAMTAGPAGAMTFYSVGTADLDGGYYRVAARICDHANRDGDAEVRCSPEPTPGSVYNLMALRRGQLDLAIVQSDWHRDAWDGVSLFQDGGPMTELRSVLSLYPEQATLLVRRGSGVAEFRDLEGKRVDIGHPSSGRHATFLTLLSAYGMKEDDFSEVTELLTGPALDALCAGAVDATLLVTGHPSATVARTLERCDVQVLPLAGPEVDRLVQANAGFSQGAIPAGSYPQLARPVATFEVRATVVARADTDPAIVTDFVRATLGGLDALRRDDPLLAGLTSEAMRTEGLSAPLHPAAEAAFAAFRASPSQ
ncbi:TAXI family TRAP transporter solute-binding subunit [Rubellimicrobium arenae]|uniref:TAXI family TRAP transporter solute-binding subunit n=1 Tax=Rubellimicrobium arenae TaxID=2817372 RepID=UPI001B307FEA|nr:TAXI family TRAP transporter solute-binding subunit [Rubellimicrobium arenae]